MPLQATSGAASYDAFGGGVPVVPNYIEDVFSTYLYTGNGSTQTITNGIDLAGKGGLVWLKSRASAYNNILFDTARGAYNKVYTNLTNAQGNSGIGVSAFNATGFDLNGNDQTNVNGNALVSWTFRKQPKFFDVVTYTGDGTNSRYISHSLGSAPGCMMIKATSTTSSWYVYHRAVALPTDTYLELNSTSASISASNMFNGTNDVRFRVNDYSGTNTNGVTYVCYLFAHNAGGFGLTGTDNVISCGSFTTDGSGNATVNLGYEPQWVLVKTTGTASPWILIDTMRGYSQTQTNRLFPNASDPESDSGSAGGVNATGFSFNGQYGSGTSLIYIAIRKGPMKVPTDGTTVFSPITSSAGTGTVQTTNFPVDLQVDQYRLGEAPKWVDRLRGVNSPNLANATPWLVSNATSAEATSTAYTNAWSNTGFSIPSYYNAVSTVYWNFRRAPSFFDEVCYTGNGTAARNITHNLTVAPEMIIVKGRTNTEQWPVWATSIAYGSNNYLSLASAVASGNTDVLNYNETTNTAVPPTSTTFTVGTHPRVNASGVTYVAYLFATCAGVSKVGSYTGTGTTLQINCGFTAGARFVLIKRTDSTGDWYVWDSARGIVAGNDPYLLLNSTAAEVTSTDYIDTYSAGFEISSTAPAAINASGGTFIFLAIA